jgi:lipid-binding SYLF domain-containing protein
MNKRNVFWTTVLTIGLVFATIGIAPAQTKNSSSTANIPSDQRDYADRAREAGSVLTEIMNIPEGGIPDTLMAKAQGIAVIPHMVKGAFGIGGTYGKGLVAQRLANGKWGTPAFVEMGGASIGFQLGAEATDLVLVFTNDDGLKSLLKGKVKLGADASVAAGPVGRKGEAATDVLLNSAIYSYSRNKGLFAGVSLDGSVVSMDDSANQKVFGKNIVAADIVSGKIASNAVVKPFTDALANVSPRKVSAR